MIEERDKGSRMNHEHAGRCGVIEESGLGSELHLVRIKLDDLERDAVLISGEYLHPKARVTKTCGYKSWGMMPPCVLTPGHDGDHEHGFGEQEVSP